MNSHPLASLVACAALATALATTLAAQTSALPNATPAPLRAPQSAISDAFGAGHTDGVTWAAGPGYKAVFTPGAVEFTPVLAAQAPRNQPVRFTLESVRRGATTVFVPPAAGRGGAWQVADRRVFVDHGGGLVERYDVAAEHLEQSFVFAAPPAGTGDLVVRLRLDTELEAVPGEDLDRLQLRCAHGGVDIGQVVGIDAAGRTAAGSMHFDGSHLELVLDDEFVRTAAYPLVLDPPIGTALFVNSQVVTDVDVAFHHSGTYLIVWQHSYSSTDTDVRGIRVDAAGNTVGPVIWIAADTSEEGSPAVASIRDRDTFFVAYAEERGFFDYEDIRGRTVGINGSMSTKVDITSSAAVIEDEPDVSGDSTGLTDAAFVVYRNAGVGIIGRQVWVSASGVSTIGVPIPIFGNPAASQPAITKSHGTESPYQMACVSELGDDLLMRVLHRNGIPATDQGWLPAGPGFSRTNPDVDGDGATFVAVYEQNEGIFLSDRDVWGLQFWDPQPLSNLGTIVSFTAMLLEDTPFDDEFEPSVSTMFPDSWGETRWLVTFSDEGSGGTELWGTSLSGSPPQRCGPSHRIDSGAINRVSRVASRYSGGLPPAGLPALSGEALVAWIAPLTAVHARRWESFVGGPITQVAPGCGVGGTASFSSTPALGNHAFGFDLTGGANGTAPGAFAMLDVAGQPLNQFCGCTIISTTHVLFFLANNGNAHWSWTPRCDPSYVGVDVTLQWAVLSGLPGGCTTVPGLHFSNAVRATLGW